MAEQVQLFTLSQDDVIDILQSKRSDSPVSLVALDCNWGSPVSGRFDTDFLQVWASADNRLNPKRVALVGTREDGAWDLEVEMAHVGDFANQQLMFVSCPPPFPTEFVIRMESGDGTLHYDNNGGYGINYALKPYAGRVTSAVAGDPAKTGPGAPQGAIWVLSGFTRYRLVARSQIG